MSCKVIYLCISFLLSVFLENYEWQEHFLFRSLFYISDFLLCTKSARVTKHNPLHVTSRKILTHAGPESQTPHLQTSPEAHPYVTPRPPWSAAPQPSSQPLPKHPLSCFQCSHHVTPFSTFHSAPFSPFNVVQLLEKNAPCLIPISPFYF